MAEDGSSSSVADNLGTYTMVVVQYWIAYGSKCLIMLVKSAPIQNIECT